MHKRTFLRLSTQLVRCKLVTNGHKNNSATPCAQLLSLPDLHSTCPYSGVRSVVVAILNRENGALTGIAQPRTGSSTFGHGEDTEVVFVF